MFQAEERVYIKTHKWEAIKRIQEAEEFILFEIKWKEDS